MDKLIINYKNESGLDGRMEINILLFFPCPIEVAKKVFPLIVKWCPKEAIDELKETLQQHIDTFKESIQTNSKEYSRAKDNVATLLTLISTGKHAVGTKMTKEELAIARNDLEHQKWVVARCASNIKRFRREIPRLEKNLKMLDEYLEKEGA